MPNYNFNSAFTPPNGLLNVNSYPMQPASGTAARQQFMDFFNLLLENDNFLKSFTDNYISKMYPVGSIYISINSTNPSTLFGGTWEQLKDKFLLSAGDTHVAGTTGGEETHTLSIAEIPSHLPDMCGSAWTSGTTKFQLTGATGTNGYTGTENCKGQPHNNMPPYLTVFMWKRVS